MAARDGRIKRGDRIASINGESLVGVPNKTVLLMLKNAQEELTLELVRKVVRKESVCSTPWSGLQSR